MKRTRRVQGVVSGRRWRKPKDGYKTGVIEWSSAGTGKHKQYSGLSDRDRELMRLQTQAWVIRKENDARAGTRVKDMLYGLPSKKRMASQRKAGRRA
jgi:hypothetical protein